MTCPYRIRDLADLDAAFNNPAVSAVHALEPMTPLAPLPAAIYAKVMESEPGRQSQRSLLATDDTKTDGRPAGYHSRLARPVKEALAWFTGRPGFRYTLDARASTFALQIGGIPRPVDLASVAWRVPLATMAVDGFGFHPSDLPSIHDWSRAQTDLIWRRGIDEDGQLAGLEAARDLSAACAAVVDAHIAHPADDVTTRLLESDSGLTREEVVGLVYGLTIASHEATSHAIALTVRYLLTWGEWGAAAGDGAVRLVSEALREDPPIHTLHRTAVADVPLPTGGCVRAGARIEGDLRAATQAGGAVWAFGVPGTPHFCLGARLGRLEVLAVVRALAEMWPDARLADPDDEAEVDSRFFAGPARLLLDLGGER